MKCIYFLFQILYKNSNIAKVTMASKRSSSDGKKSRDETKSKKAKTLANEIHDACLTGEIENVKSLLKEDRLESAGIKELNKKKTLINLSQNGKAELSKELLKNGVNPNCKNNDGETPLHVACRNGHVDVVMELLNHGANVNAENHEKECPLVLIDVWELNEDLATTIAQKLLEHGANINSQSKEGSTLLSTAATAGNFSLVCKLLKHGADVNLRDKISQTPLHDASNCNIVRELIKHGASINAKDDDGNTPLHIASEHGYIPELKELLRHKASLKIRNNEGYTAIRLASSMGQALVVKEFLEHSITAKKQVKKDCALHIAAINGQIEVVMTILEHGLEVDQRDKDYINTTPLHDAVENGHIAIVKLLLIYGADINAVTNDGESILHTMLHGRNLEEPYPEQKMLEVMMELLNDKYKIDLNLKCCKGLTPLETAIKLGRLNMTKMIAKVLCPKPKISDSIYPLKQLL